MVYCLLNNSCLNDNNIEINYSLINDSEELKINKIFNIDLNKNKINYHTFTQDQFKKNILANHIDEIKNDFGRSKYIFGKNEFKDYFYELDSLNQFNENFEFKYMKISDLIIGVNRLKFNIEN